MIKKQYTRYSDSYFINFMNAHDGYSTIEEELKSYRATIGKSKNDHYKFNVKWHDDKLYVLFVLKWS